MTQQEVIEFMEGSGYKSYPDPLQTAMWAGQKYCPKGTALCGTNEHKISWHARIYDFKIRDVHHKSITIEIIAEKNNQWYKLQAYGIEFNETNKLEELEQKLLKAWEAVQ